MMRFALSSETFQRLLFNLDSKSSAQKTLVPTILASLKPQTVKNSKIVIISNGVEQSQNRVQRKRYVFTDDEIESKSSEVGSYSLQKKHVIKKEKKEDPDYSIKRQKGDRNVISNIIHHLMKHCLSYIPEEKLLYIFQKKNLKLSTKQFMDILSQKDKLCKTYITNKHLKSLWDDGERPQFSLAMRIISRTFLQNYSFLTIFNGNKLNRESKAIHYKGRRELIHFLSKIK